jgi:hypothetical protein
MVALKACCRALIGRRSISGSEPALAMLRSHYRGLQRQMIGSFSLKNSVKRALRWIV